MELLESHFENLNGNLYFDGKTYEMFSGKGDPKHLNYLTFKELFKQMDNKRDLVILETGIASCGTNSTYLFDQYIRKYGGRFWSVDINKHLVDYHGGNMCPATQLVCDDSINFLKNWIKNHPNTKPDVVYLDSYDINWYNPLPAAIHGMNEYLAIKPVMVKDSLLLIDDTPSSPYWLDTRGELFHDMVKYYDTNKNLPGKGQFVVDFEKDATKLMHNYQVLYKF